MVGDAEGVAQRFDCRKSLIVAEESREGYGRWICGVLESLSADTEREQEDDGDR